MSDLLQEPWLRGPLPGVDPLVAPAIYSFQMAREDLAQHVNGLSPEQVWARPHGLTPLGFHLKHIAGSVDRLMTYLQGHMLDETQMAALRLEQEPGGESAEVLLAWVNESLAQAEEILRELNPRSLAESRTVGRKQHPATVMGLMFHIAEHTARHVGEAIAAAKLVRAVSVRSAPAG